MEEQLISFETAKLAKEKGFSMPCISHWSTHDHDGKQNKCIYKSENDNLYGNYGYLDWNDNHEFLGYISNKDEKRYSAPTQSLLQKWLREEYNCIVDVYWNRVEREKPHFEWYSTIDYHGKNMENKITDDADFVSNIYTSYEEALEIALYEALKLIKTK